MNRNNLTKVIIADDHLLFADGLEQIVTAMEGFAVIKKLRDGKSLLHSLVDIVPDMILMDINMPKINGIDAATQILRSYKQVKIVFISMYYNATLVEQAKAMGAYGFIMKDVTASVLKEAIRNAQQGIRTFLTPDNNDLLENKLDEADPFLLQQKLSPREVEIIRLIKGGNSTKQIAAILELSAYTVETHRKNINRKLRVQSTAELIAFAHSHLR